MYNPKQSTYKKQLLAQRENNTTFGDCLAYIATVAVLITIAIII